MMGNRGMNFAEDSFGGMNFDALNALRQKSRGMGMGARGGGFQDRRRNFGRLGNASPLMKTSGRSEDDGGEVAMKTVSVNPDTVVSFFGRRHYLSTFYSAPMLIAGHHYPTVEHYYEACKIYAVAGPESAMFLKDVDDPVQVKNTVKRIMESQNIPRQAVNSWKRQDGLLVVRVGLMEKFRQNPKLREQLFKTGDALLVQCSQGDGLWSTNTRVDEFNKWVEEHKGEKLQVPVLVEPKSVNKVPDICKGKNLLGFTLMYVRDCLRSEYGVMSRGFGAATNSIMEADK